VGVKKNLRCGVGKFSEKKLRSGLRVWGGLGWGGDLGWGLFDLNVGKCVQNRLRGFGLLS
jgi:hypothetical protein